MFDLDKSVSEAVSSTLRYQLTPDGAVPIEVRIPSFYSRNMQLKCVLKSLCV